ncbi:MAG: oligoendopeptidase F [Bacillales bacterium]|jgi:oligoendopeptidase F|nr:oligoendopeptidase F [Bacillales bacterium]
MKWDLTYFYATSEDFEKDLKELETYIEKVSLLKGKLKEKETLKKYYYLNSEVEKKLLKIFQYASLRSDLNQKDVKNAQDLMRVYMFFNRLGEATSFIGPELLSLDKQYILETLNSDSQLKQYSFGIEKLFRSKKHILDGKSEKLLSFYAPLAEKGSSLYDKLSTADKISAKVTLSTGEVTVTQGNWTVLITDAKTEEDRKLIFEAIFKPFADYKNTYAEIYNTLMAEELASTKARKYKNILDSHLYRNNIPSKVYENLVSVASSRNGAVKKYLKLRKKYLGLKEYHTYDRFLELAKSNKKYSYEEGKALFFKSLEKFPKDFQDKAREVLRDGFVDVFESDGKRSGAYSSGQADTHPFILLNYTDDLDDVFTLAHEAGHSMHTLYSQQAQPTQLQDYTIFVAEIASTFNENILLDYLMTSAELDKDSKIKLLQKSIDSIMSTFYRQALFADYELRASRLFEEGNPLTYEVLSKIMKDLYQKYYGLDISKETYKEFVWAYIPHLFHSPFYVYQYATSISASLKLYQNVKEGVAGSFDRYINLLKSGGSKFPVEQAKEAGIDFLDKATFVGVADRLNDLVNQLEQLLK